MQLFASAGPWFNTTDFTPFELTLFVIGCLGWVIAYIWVLKFILKRKFVEIPAGAVVANIAWEFVWGFLFISNMGMAFAWGYRIWFFLDCFIVYSLFKYGRKQFEEPTLKRFFVPASAFGILAWAVMIYFFVAGGYDTGYGAVSGYILNAMMSALYIVLILRHSDVRDFSAVVAWSKGLGTAILTVFNVMVQSHNYLLLTLCFVTLLLDALYIVAFYMKTRQAIAQAT